MSQEGIKKLIGRIITDEEFKKGFFENRARTVKMSGYDVSLQELEALATLKAEDLEFEITEVIGANHNATEIECGAKVKTWMPSPDKERIVLTRPIAETIKTPGKNIIR